MKNSTQRKARIYSVSNFFVYGLVFGALAGFFLSVRMPEKIIMAVFLGLIWGGLAALFAAASNKIERMKEQRRNARIAQ